MIEIYHNDIVVFTGDFDIAVDMINKLKSGKNGFWKVYGVNNAYGLALGRTFSSFKKNLNKLSNNRRGLV